jgi:GAF domain-containing protein
MAGGSVPADPGSDPQRDHVALEEVAQIARRLAEAETIDELLHRIVGLGADYVDGCDGVSLMLVRRGGRLSSPAYSSSIAYQSDLAQYETDEGPCLEAIRDHETIVVDDLEDETRWPEYRARAKELGVRSMAGFRLFLLGDTMGALDFYSKQPGVFGGRAKLLGQVFASHAGVALKAAITETNLEAALASRDVIGQAKGVLMTRHGLTADQAFVRLRELSQDQNRRLRDVAEEVARTGDA